ncbi:MerR family transcriptional regulator [Cupriavidus basilensis]|uniref:MerR family transcriptional regulator n=1 Tax=Cupriavidus basilensis TaxID=68895 RepID=A0ABT6B4H0_9BURK|nr:MerR family transcriptional regulator [Cupriavidus basilensis]MDF3839770.1 MerR family transcriptional regulator [Cupriavidus basilensis]
MLLRVGDLAKRCGLTVRTLHHYDSIGLLTPSARSDSGYRLYSQRDISRLHQIQALRRFGVSLAGIGEVLANPEISPTAVLEQQIRMLDQQISRTVGLRDRLAQMHAQFVAGVEPDAADWLSTLEMMTMYDKYFSPDELDALPFYQTGQAQQQEWALLVAEVNTLMQAGAPARGAQAQALSVRWMALLERDTAANPTLAAKLNAMHASEEALQAQTGISPQTVDYVMEAFAETKLALYETYLTPVEFAHMRANYGKQMRHWPPLIAAVREAMTQGKTPGDPAVQDLAQRWLALFRAYAGDDPATQQKIRRALEAEPRLTEGTWVDAALLGYLRDALATLPAR